MYCLKKIAVQHNGVSKLPWDNGGFHWWCVVWRRKQCEVWILYVQDQGCSDVPQQGFQKQSRYNLDQSNTHLILIVVCSEVFHMLETSCACWLIQNPNSYDQELKKAGTRRCTPRYIHIHHSRFTFNNSLVLMVRRVDCGDSLWQGSTVKSF